MQAKTAGFTKPLGTRSIRCPDPNISWRTVASTSLATILLGFGAQRSYGAACDFDHELATKKLSASDYAGAREIYEAAAACGNAEALYDLAVIKARGLGGPRDEREAVRLYAESAALGYADAQNNLGVMYVLGRGVPVDPVVGDMWFQIAARGGHRGAQANDKEARSTMSAEQVADATAKADEWALRAGK